MGTSTSARQLASKFFDAAANVHAAKRTGLVAEALFVKEALLRAPGAPHTVAGRKAGVRFDLRGDEAVVRWFGPVHLVNNPTAPHEIRPRAFAGTRSTGTRAQRGAGLLAAFGVDATQSRGAVRLADGNVRSRVSHPGTAGKQFFQKGKAVAQAQAFKAYSRSVHSALAEAFL